MEVEQAVGEEAGVEAQVEVVAGAVQAQPRAVGGQLVEVQAQVEGAAAPRLEALLEPAGEDVGVRAQVGGGADLEPGLARPRRAGLGEARGEWLEQSLDTEIIKKIRWSIDLIKTKHFNQNLIDFVREYLELTYYPGTISNAEGIIPIPSKEVLTKIYTPGVAKICLLIEALRSEARDLRDIASFLPTTGKEKLKVQKEILNRTEYINGTVLALSFTNAAIHINRITNYELVKRRISLVPDPVLIITDNTAVLGLGDIGTYAGIPVMVGKKMIMNYLGNINAIPISIETRDPKEIIEIVKMIAPDKGAINLEDISAPRCFEIEKQLDQDLKIPVFHDDQHGLKMGMQ
jgi:hypothetical protein